MNYTQPQKTKMEKHYQLNVLSILKRRLADVINDRTPLHEFSTQAMRQRAVEPVLPMKDWQLEGYPPRII